MSYTSTSGVERIGTCSIVGLSGIAFASAMIAAQKSSKSGGRTVVVPNCSAGLRVCVCVSVIYSITLCVCGHCARRIRTNISLCPRDRTDQVPQHLDDDPLLAGLHRLRGDHDTVRPGGR